MRTWGSKKGLAASLEGTSNPGHSMRGSGGGQWYLLTTARDRRARSVFSMYSQAEIVGNGDTQFFDAPV
jgi:hypothetical protein